MNNLRETLYIILFPQLPFPKFILVPVFLGILGGSVITLITGSLTRAGVAVMSGWTAYLLGAWGLLYSLVGLYRVFSIRDKD